MDDRRWFALESSLSFVVAVCLYDARRRRALMGARTENGEDSKNKLQKWVSESRHNELSHEYKAARLELLMLRELCANFADVILMIFRFTSGGSKKSCQAKTLWLLAFSSCEAFFFCYLTLFCAELGKAL